MFLFCYSLLFLSCLLCVLSFKGLLKTSEALERTDLLTCGGEGKEKSLSGPLKKFFFSVWCLHNFRYGNQRNDMFCGGGSVSLSMQFSFLKLRDFHYCYRSYGEFFLYHSRKCLLVYVTGKHRVNVSERCGGRWYGVQFKVNETSFV